MTAASGAGPDPHQQRSQPQPSRETALLDSRYGAIGIGAVSAALRYAGASRNPAYAPVAPRIVARYEDAA